MRLCNLKECNNKHLARGYCRGHYKQIRKWGKITSIKLRKMDGTQGCIIIGCLLKHHAKGYCNKHLA